ncbi:hypothetical protein BDZ90DRAFT_43901 [Jaminaea rosea]|uniref:Uncharacterized protein n=1 Tax=Jaminaea rosea TaxID=1569628 RepID=A0A316UMX8_9BASI|nr:hypothetical protein BDZ90DRAFT_43901 [Jaminaea rosea]PWN26616.1 hypothetical protein BDZ90DRAFT_43901 [Jaminaea rosea]
MLLSLIALLAYACFIAADPAEDVQALCNAANNAYCFYSPIAAFLWSIPEVKTETGSILAQDRDAVGSVTYLLDEGSTGEYIIFCKSVGSNRFTFSLGLPGSQITSDPASRGPARVYFNDNPDVYASPGQTIKSSTPGVDATVTCPH